MGKIPDRAKMRRDYLRKKRHAEDITAVFTTFTFSALFVAAITSVGLFKFLVFLANRPEDSVISIIGISLLLIAILSLLTASSVAGFVGIVVCRSYFQWATEIPYVPSVDEQLATLPAEEVLLRGSHLSPASPEELLRPAAGQMTPAKELLRSAVKSSS